MAHGAAYYGQVRRGKGVRIRGGVGRSYYVGLETAAPAVPGVAQPIKALCVVPMGMEEGTETDVPGPEIGLVVGEPAQFRFLGSTIRRDDSVGTILERWNTEELQELTRSRPRWKPTTAPRASPCRSGSTHESPRSGPSSCRARAPATRGAGSWNSTCASRMSRRSGTLAGLAVHEYIMDKPTPLRNEATDMSDVVLTIEGAVERPLRLTFADLEALPEPAQVRDVSRFHPTRQGDGVALDAILDRAGVHAGGELPDPARRSRRLPRLDAARRRFAARESSCTGLGRTGWVSKHGGPIRLLDPRPVRLPHRRARRVRQREVSEPDRADRAARPRHPPGQRSRAHGTARVAGGAVSRSIRSSLSQPTNRRRSGFSDATHRRESRAAWGNLETSVRGRSRTAGEKLGELPGEDDQGDGARAEGGHQHAGGGDFARRLQPRLLGIADRRAPGCRPRCAPARRSRPEQAAMHQQAPAPLIDSQECGRDRDQRPPIAVREEAGVAPDRRLEPPPARRELAAGVAAIGLRGQVRGRIEIQARGRRSREPAAATQGRLDVDRRAGHAGLVWAASTSFMVVAPSSIMTGHWVGANRVSKRPHAASSLRSSAPD